MEQSPPAGHYVPAEKRQMGRARANKAPFQITSLYVKYLDDTVNDDVLRGMFYACGQVTSAKVEVKENGISKGFGYVNFSTPEEATKAMTEMNGKTFGSKPLYVSLHMTRDQRMQFMMSQGIRQNGFRQPTHMMPYTMFFPGMMPGFQQNRMMGRQPMHITSLYVKYLDDSVNDDVLREMFAACGQVTSAKVEVKENGISKGFGYVIFSTPEEATKAITEMNGKTFGSKPLYVSLHMTRDQRMQFMIAQRVRQNGFRQPMHMMPYTMFFPGMMATARGSNRTA
jgi:polyadenylate-binding protein